MQDSKFSTEIKSSENFIPGIYFLMKSFVSNVKYTFQLKRYGCDSIIMFFCYENGDLSKHKCYRYEQIMELQPDRLCRLDQSSFYYL